MLARIQHVEVDQTRLLVAYDGGRRIVVDITPWIQEGGVWAQLANPDFLNQVKVGEGGRYLSWPGDLDVCADALLADSTTMSPVGAK
jgi:hypothetical protein